MTLQAIQPDRFPWFDYRRYTFSLGLQAGERAYLSGHSASEYDAGERRIVVRGGMSEQASTAYAKVEAILAGAGRGLGDAVRVVENITLEGIEHYDEAVEVRGKVFGAHDPVVVTVVVERLLRDGALIEVEVSAAAGGGEPIGASDTASWRRDRLREVAGIVYLPTVLPVDLTGAVVAPGDGLAQYRYCLERVAELLDVAGLGTNSVARLVDYATPAAGPASARGALREELLAAPWPASGSITTTRLQAPGIEVAVDAVASRHELRPVESGARRAVAGSSPAVRTGAMLFCSTLTAAGASSAGEDVAGQAERIYGDLLGLLAAGGMGPDQLVKTIEYVTHAGLGTYRGVAGVRERLLVEPYPASTGAVCASVGADDLLLAVEATALDT